MKAALFASAILAVMLTGCSEAAKGKAEGEGAKTSQAKTEAELAKAKLEAANAQGETQLARVKAEAEAAKPAQAKAEAELAKAKLKAAKPEEAIGYKFEKGDTIEYSVEKKKILAPPDKTQRNETNQLSITQLTEVTWHIQEVDDQGKAKIAGRIKRIQVTISGSDGKIFFDSSKDKAVPSEVKSRIPSLSLFYPFGQVDCLFSLTPKGEVAFHPKLVNTALGVEQLPEFERMILEPHIPLPKEKLLGKGVTWTRARSDMSVMGLGPGRGVSENAQRMADAYDIDDRLTHEGSKTVAEKKVEVISMSSTGKMREKTINQLIRSQNSTGAALFDAARGRLLELKIHHAIDFGLKNQIYEDSFQCNLVDKEK